MGKDDDSPDDGLPSEYTGGSCNVNDYGRVQIGNQVWLAKNWGCYASGSKCYGNAKSDCNKYGRLYNWETAKTVCPSGWHLPSHSDWGELIDYVESDNGCSSCAGKHLKAKSGWSSGGNGTDTYGFAALPGGRGYSDGGFDNNVGSRGYWWSTSEDDANYAYSQGMSYDFEYVGWYSSYGKNNLFSVRCVKD